jgi:hypothetical protein
MTQSFEDLIHNYYAAYDTIGGETYAKSFRVLIEMDIKNVCIVLRAILLLIKIQYVG